LGAVKRGKNMSFTLMGWPEGHPHQTTIEGYPFGYVEPTSPNPLRDKNRDGYASSFNRLYRDYERRAAKKGREFTISPEDFYFFTSQPCILCAAPPSQRRTKAKNPYIYNGLDRWDSSRGYTIDNIVACCWRHNRIKGTLGYAELYKQCLGIVLSISSKTAVDMGDVECLDLLIKLWPNVQFLKQHRLALLERSEAGPRAEPRFNWLLRPVQPQ
jgi:hypothetical protein